MQSLSAPVRSPFSSHRIWPITLHIKPENQAMSISRNAISLIALFTLIGAASAQTTDPKFEAKWRAACVQVRNSFAQWNDQFYACPSYQPRYLNSNHADMHQWTKENTTTLTFEQADKQWIKPETLVPPTAEAEAHCKMLPGFSAGQYGYIKSAIIEAVKPGVGFVVRDVVLVDEAATQAAYEKDQKAYDAWLTQLRDQKHQENRTRFKSGKSFIAGPGIEGYIVKRKEAMENRYSARQRLLQVQRQAQGQRLLIMGPVTSSMKPGRIWSGSRTQIVITGMSDDPINAGAKILTAVTGEQFKRGISADQLENLLSEKDVTRESFVAMVESANAADRATANQRVFAALGYQTQPAPLAAVQAQPTASDDNRLTTVTPHERKQFKRWKRRRAD